MVNLHLKNKVSTDQYYAIILRALVIAHRGQVFFNEVDRGPSTGFRFDRRLMLFLAQNGGHTHSSCMQLNTGIAPY